MKKALGYLKPDILLALTLYCITCIVLYFVQYVWFGGALRTVFINALIYPPIFLLCWFFSDKEAKPKQQIKGNIFRVISVIALFILGCALAIASIIRGNIIIGIQIFGMFIALGILVIYKALRHLPSISGAYIVAAVYSSILIVTAAFILIAKPTTINAAKKSLTGEGYQNLSYIMSYQNELLPNLIFDGKLPNTDSIIYDLGIYLFSGELDNNYYGILVDIASGEILIRDNVEKNNVLSGVIEIRG